MSGVPGAGGPIPKRSSERRRTNSAPAETVTPPAAPVAAPDLPEGTHPLAREWYESLQVSGQAQYYEPSDWTQAKFVAATMTQFFLMGGSNANMFAAIQAAMRELLTTEGARRRVRLEVERPKPQPEGVVERPGNVSDIRARVSQGGRRGR